MPRIQTTRTVRIALILLRVYLLAMLLIILSKFVIEARGKGGREAQGPAASRQTGTMPAAAPHRDSAGPPQAAAE
jgi:hypothetical protein